MRLLFLLLAFGSTGMAYLLQREHENASWFFWTAALLFAVCTLSYRKQQ